MYGLLVGFGLMFDKGQKQSSTLSCDSSYISIYTGRINHCSDARIKIKMVTTVTAY